MVSEEQQDESSLQVSGVAAVGGRHFFRCFRIVDANQTVTSRTLLLDDSGHLVREFDEEIVAIAEMKPNTLVAVGSYGAVYQYELATGSWSDWTGRFEPVEVFSRIAVLDGTLYAVGTARMLVRFSGDQWVRAVQEFGEDEDIDLYGLCADGDAGGWLCGSEGFLAHVDTRAAKVELVELNSAATLTAVAICGEGVMACGSGGSLWVRTGGDWQEAGATTDAHFSGLACWRGEMLVAGGDHVYRFASGLEQSQAISCLNLVSTASSVWSIGLHILHKNVGQGWQQVQMPDPQPPVEERKRAVKKPI